MSYKFRVADLSIGGAGRDNPVPLTADNYRFEGSEQQLYTYSVNVIAPYDSLTKQVTALAQTDQSGNPMLQPTDFVCVPCPPFC